MSAEAEFFDFSNFLNLLETGFLSEYKADFISVLSNGINKADGHIPQWLRLYSKLPNAPKTSISALGDAVKIGSEGDISSQEVKNLRQILILLAPWRKGPFELFNILIDAEWRSNLKWQRIMRSVGSLKGKTILDIGCGNGYYMLKAVGEGAKTVIGADPTMPFYAQYKFLTKYCNVENAHFLPVKFEAFPLDMQRFDVVFALGIFYHRRDPFDFLRRLKMLLIPNGTLVFETLIVEGGENTVFVPEDRYARMHNIWFIPSVLAMIKWLKKAGFNNVKATDITPTTSYEQRVTEWMSGESLEKCLDPNDLTKTIEGAPAPVRAMFAAQA